MSLFIFIWIPMGWLKNHPCNALLSPNGCGENLELQRAHNEALGSSIAERKQSIAENGTVHTIQPIISSTQSRTRETTYTYPSLMA
jgi:hypothetical protein